MRTVLVANGKGGSGKTTVATHLAVAWAAQGRSVGLADADKQRCAAAWLAARPGTAAAVAAADADDPATHAGLDALVIDAPAGVKRARLEALVKAADAVVVPVMPSLFDEVGAARFLARLAELKPVRKGLPVAVVANRVRFHAGEPPGATLAGVMTASAPFTVVATLRDAAIYADLAAAGLTVFDRAAKRSAAARSDWDPLLSWLGELARP